jgi:hypothetical protein
MGCCWRFPDVFAFSKVSEYSSEKLIHGSIWGFQLKVRSDEILRLAWMTYRRTDRNSPNPVGTDFNSLAFTFSIIIIIWIMQSELFVEYHGAL